MPLFSTSGSTTDMPVIFQVIVDAHGSDAEMFLGRLLNCLLVPGVEFQHLKYSRDYVQHGIWGTSQEDGDLCNFRGGGGGLFRGFRATG